MRIVVGVLRGGPSPEYDTSLKTGASVLGALNRDTYEPRDIFIDKAGQWHAHGLPATPERALRGVDVAFNALHGHYGEDGQVQRLLDGLGIRYTGSGAFSSAMAFNKQTTKQAVAALGIAVPHGVVLDAEKITDFEATALNLFRSFPQPSIVKPVASGSSLGVALADSYHALVAALEYAFAHSKKILIEEFIKGREASVGVVDHFRNERSYALMPTEIILPPHRAFYDIEAKYGGDSRLMTPASFGDDTKLRLQELARSIHEGLELRHASRSEFRISPRGIYFMEVETVPDLTDDSEFVHSLNAVGAPLTHFLDHVISLAHNG